MSAYKRMRWAVLTAVVVLAGNASFAQQETVEDQDLINLLNQIREDSDSNESMQSVDATDATNAVSDADSQIDEMTLGEGMVDELNMNDVLTSMETGADNRISIRFKGGLSEAISLFAQLSGANIIVPELADAAQVSVNLKDVEWRPALQSILDTYDYELYQRVAGSNVYSVRRRPAGAPEAQVVETFVLRYATVPNAAALIRQLLPDDAKVSEFASRNMLVIKSTESSLGEVRSVLESIDTVRQQVYIESKFMELTDDAQKDLGVDWSVLQAYSAGTVGNPSYAYGRANDSTVLSDVDGIEYNDASTYLNPANAHGGTSPILEGLTPTGMEATSKVLTSVLDADEFRVVLSALKQNTGVNIVSNPKIIVANEESANISIIRKEPNLKQERQQALNDTPDTITFTLDQDLPFFEYGIKLDVVPSINTSSNITVQINPSLTRKFADKQAGNNTYPIIDEKSIKTIFNLASGQTAAIGGLTKATEKDIERKVPLLGSIPLVGRLFSWEQTVNGQEETIIFVTVGLANTQELNTETGMPSDAELARRQVIQDRNSRALRDQGREYYEAEENDKLDDLLKVMESKEQERLEQRQKALQKESGGQNVALAN